MPGLEGTTLGPYHIQRLLGKGGMAEVYLAHDEALDRDVAVKVVSGNHGDYLERFWREVEAIDKLTHEHILPAYDYDDEGPLHYLVTLYTTHGTLHDRLQKGPLTPEEASKILDQVADALQFAHDHGIIHRDIKPSNILLHDEHYVYLGDFGLAKSMDGAHRLTQTGILMGTPEYMAPDLADGPATTSSDIYALGIVLYEMLTGQVPFSAETPMAVYWKQIRDQPRPPSVLNPALSRAIDKVILRALEKDPRNRFQTTRELANAYKWALRAPALYEAEQETLYKRIEKRERQRHPHTIEPSPPRQHRPARRLTNPARVVVRPVVQPASLGEHAFPGVPASQGVPARVHKGSSLHWSGGAAPARSERHTPSPVEHPPLHSPVRSSSAEEEHVDTFVLPRPERAQHNARRRRAIVVGVVSAGLFFFVVLPMTIIYYMFATYARPAATVTASVNGKFPTVRALESKATANAAAIATATSGAPILTDSLATNSAGRWTEDSARCVFIGGSYHIIVQQADFLQSCPLLTTTMDDATVQVDVSLPSGNDAGMLLRLKDEQFYDFEINNQGQFFFRRHDTGTGSHYVYLIPPSTSSAIATGGQKNTLLAVAKGDDFKLYINGAFVGETHDSSYESGQIALAAGTQSGQSIGEGNLANFRMYKVT